MKYRLCVSFITLFILLLLFQQCSTEEDYEDLYYEPIIQGTFIIETDQEQSVEFTIEPQKSLTINGKFDNGISFTLEFGEETLRHFEKVNAKISPVTGIADLPSDFQFHFGFVFTPEGVEFNNPGKMTVELPAGVNISDFKGFVFDGGESNGTLTSEIWNVKMTPVSYGTTNGKKTAIFEIPHFSGFIGASGGDIKCGSPRAAYSCEELKEILACYIIGKDELDNETLKKVNDAIRIYIEDGITALQENPSEIDEFWEVELAAQELICLKEAALWFNSSLNSFGDLFTRAGSFLGSTLIKKLNEENDLCDQIEDVCERANNFGMNYLFVILHDNLQSSGLISTSTEVSLANYCDSIASNYRTNPTLDTTVNYLYHTGFGYRIDFYTHDPSNPKTVPIRVYAENLLGEYFELEYEKDYYLTFSNEDMEQAIYLENSSIKERFICCDDYGNYIHLNASGFVKVILTSFDENSSCHQNILIEFNSY